MSKNWSQKLINAFVPEQQSPPAFVFACICFCICICIAIQQNEMLLLKYMNLFANIRGLPFNWKIFYMSSHRDECFLLPAPGWVWTQLTHPITNQHKCSSHDANPLRIRIRVVPCVVCLRETWDLWETHFFSSLKISNKNILKNILEI